MFEMVMQWKTMLAASSVLPGMSGPCNLCRTTGDEIIPIFISKKHLTIPLGPPPLFLGFPRLLFVSSFFALAFVGRSS